MTFFESQMAECSSALVPTTTVAPSSSHSKSESIIERLSVAPLCTFVPPPLGDPSALEHPPGGNNTQTSWGEEGGLNTRSVCSARPGSASGRNRHVLWVSPEDDDENIEEYNENNEEEEESADGCLRTSPPWSNKAYSRQLQMVRQLLLFQIPKQQSHAACEGDTSSVAHESAKYNSFVGDACTSGSISAHHRQQQHDRWRRRSTTGPTGGGPNNVASCGAYDRQVAVINLLTQGGFRLMYFLVKNWSILLDPERGSSRGEAGVPPRDGLSRGADEDNGDFGGGHGDGDGSAREGAERPRALQLELLQLLTQIVNNTCWLVKACLAPAGNSTARELAVQVLVARRLQKGSALGRKEKRKKKKAKRAWGTDDAGGEGDLSLPLLFDQESGGDDSDGMSSSENQEEHEEEESDREDEMDFARLNSGERRLESDDGDRVQKLQQSRTAGQRILSGQEAIEVARTMRSLILCVSFFAEWLLRCVLESAEQQAVALAAGGSDDAMVDPDTFGGLERQRGVGAGGARLGRGAAANAAAGKSRYSKVGSKRRPGQGSGQQRGTSSVVSNSKRMESALRRRGGRRQNKPLDSSDEGENNSGTYMSEGEEGEEKNQVADDQRTPVAGIDHHRFDSSFPFPPFGATNIGDYVSGATDRLSRASSCAHATRGELPSLLGALGDLGGCGRMWRAFASDVGGEEREENLQRLQLVRALLRPLSLLYDEEKVKFFTRLPSQAACSCLYADGAGVVMGTARKIVIVEPLKQTTKFALQKVLQQIERRRRLQKRLQQWQQQQREQQQREEDLRRRGTGEDGTTKQEEEESCNETMDGTLTGIRSKNDKESHHESAPESERKETGGGRHRDCGAAAGGADHKATAEDSDEEDSEKDGGDEQSWRMQLDGVVLKPECRALIEIFAAPELRESRLPVRLARELAQQLREQLLLCGGVERATLAQRQMFSMTAGSLEELARVLPRVWLKGKRLLFELFAADAYHIRKALLECLKSLLIRAHLILDLNEPEDMFETSSSGVVGDNNSSNSSTRGALKKRKGGGFLLSDSDDDNSEGGGQEDYSKKRKRVSRKELKTDSADEEDEFWWGLSDGVHTRGGGSESSRGHSRLSQENDDDDNERERRIIVQGGGHSFGSEETAVIARRRFWAMHRTELLALLLERLQDKTPLARSWALKVLADLIGEKEALPPAGVLRAVRAASKRLLDKSTLVRGAAFSVLTALLHVALKQLERMQQQSQRNASDNTGENDEAWGQRPFVFLLVSLPEDWRARRKSLREQQRQQNLQKEREAGRMVASRSAVQQTTKTDGDDLSTSGDAGTHVNNNEEEADHNSAKVADTPSSSSSHRGGGGEDGDSQEKEEEQFNGGGDDPDELLLSAEDALASALRSCEDLLFSTAEGDQKAALRFIVDACLTLQLRRPQLLSSLHQALRLAFSSSAALVNLLLQEFRRLFLDPVSLEQQQQRLFQEQLLRRAWQQQHQEQLRREQEVLKRLQRKQQQLQRQLSAQLSSQSLHSQTTAIKTQQPPEASQQHASDENHNNNNVEQLHSGERDHMTKDKMAFCPANESATHEQQNDSGGVLVNTSSSSSTSTTDNSNRETNTNTDPHTPDGGGRTCAPNAGSHNNAGKDIGTGVASGRPDGSAVGGVAESGSSGGGGSGSGGSNNTIITSEGSKIHAALKMAEAAVAAAMASVHSLKEQLDCMRSAPNSTPFQQLLICDEDSCEYSRQRHRGPGGGGSWFSPIGGGKTNRGGDSLHFEGGGVTHIDTNTPDSIFRFGACKLIELAHSADVSVMACIEKLLGLAFSRDDGGGLQQQCHQLWALKHTADALFSLALTPPSGGGQVPSRCIRLGERTTRCALGLLRLLFEASHHSVKQQQHHQQEPSTGGAVSSGLSVGGGSLLALTGGGVGFSSRASTSLLPLSPHKRIGRETAKQHSTLALSSIAPGGANTHVLAGGGATGGSVRLHSLTNTQFTVLIQSMRRALGAGGGGSRSSHPPDNTSGHLGNASTTTTAVSTGKNGGAAGIIVRQPNEEGSVSSREGRNTEKASISERDRHAKSDLCTFTELCWIINATAPDRRSARAGLVALELLMDHYGTPNTRWFAAAQAVVELTFRHCVTPERLWAVVFARLLAPFVAGGCPSATGHTAMPSSILSLSDTPYHHHHPHASFSSSCSPFCTSNITTSTGVACPTGSRLSATPTTLMRTSGVILSSTTSLRPSCMTTSNGDYSSILETPTYANNKYPPGANCINNDISQGQEASSAIMVPGCSPTPTPYMNHTNTRTSTWSTGVGDVADPRGIAITQKEHHMQSGGVVQISNSTKAIGCLTPSPLISARETPPLILGAEWCRQQHQPPKISLWMLAHLVFLAGHIALRVCVLLEEQQAEMKRSRVLRHRSKSSNQPCGGRDRKKRGATPTPKKKRRLLSSSDDTSQSYNNNNMANEGSREQRRNEWAATVGTPTRLDDGGGQSGPETPPKKHQHSRQRRPSQRQRATPQRQREGGKSSGTGGGERAEESDSGDGGGGGEDDDDDSEGETTKGQDRSVACVGNDVEMNMGMQTKEEEEADLFAHILETEIVGSGLLGHPLKRLILVAALEPQRLLRSVTTTTTTTTTTAKSAAATATASTTIAAPPSPSSHSIVGSLPNAPVGGDSAANAVVDSLDQKKKKTEAHGAAASTPGVAHTQQLQANTGLQTSGEVESVGALTKPTTVPAVTSKEKDSPSGLEDLHAAAVVALCKYATVSRTFCESRICQRTSVLHALVSLLFSKPTSTKSSLSTTRNTSRRLPSALRQTLLICYGDLTCRHPNAVEPYNDVVFGILRDEDAGVRHTAVQVLTHLVMNGMVKAKGRLLVLMLLLLSDRDIRISSAAETFFYEVDRKAAYAVLNAFPELLSALAASCCCTGSSTRKSGGGEHRSTSSSNSSSSRPPHHNTGVGGVVSGASSNTGSAACGRRSSTNSGRGGNNIPVSGAKTTSGSQLLTPSYQHECGEMKTSKRQRRDSAKTVSGDEQQQHQGSSSDAAVSSQAPCSAPPHDAGNSKRYNNKKGDSSEAKQRHNRKETDDVSRRVSVEKGQFPSLQEDATDACREEINAAREHQRLLKFLLQFVKHHRHTETLVERIAQRIATLPLPAVYTLKKERCCTSSSSPSSNTRGSAKNAATAASIMRGADDTTTAGPGADSSLQVREKLRAGGGGGGLHIRLPLDPLEAMALLSSTEELSSLHPFGTPAVFGGGGKVAAQSRYQQQANEAQKKTQSHKTDAAAATAAISENQQRDEQGKSWRNSPQNEESHHHETSNNSEGNTSKETEQQQSSVQREAGSSPAVDATGQSLLQRLDMKERESMRRLYASACRRTFFEALVAVSLSAHSFEKCLRKVVSSWPLLRTAVALPEEEGGGAEQLKELVKKAASLLRSAGSGGGGGGAAGRATTACTGLGGGGIIPDGHSDGEDRSGEPSTTKRSTKGNAAGGGGAATAGGSHDATEAIRELMEDLQKKLQASTKEEEPTSPLSEIPGGEARTPTAG